MHSLSSNLWALDDVLNAIDGIAYAVDLGGRICAVGPRRWNEFAVENGSPDLMAEAVVGRPTFDYITGEDVQAFYRQRIDEACTSGDAVIVLSRCDGPCVKRELRLAITPLTRNGGIELVLFQSQVVDEVIRPPIDLFDPMKLMQAANAAGQLPITTICSICQKVQITDASIEEPVWVEAEEYYQRGGTSKVRVSHGLCPDCARREYVRS